MTRRAALLESVPPTRARPVPPEAEPQPRPVPGKPLELQVVPTVCSYCGVGCNIELHVADNRIWKITSPSTSPVNRGNLCVKGRFGHDYVHHPGRLTEPLIRRGAREAWRAGGKPDRGRGALDFEPATWDEALDLVTERFAAIRAAHGPDAIGGFSSAKCTNEENYLFQKFMRAVIGTHNVDHCSRLCHASSVTAVNMAIGSTAMSNSITDIRDSRCLLVTGSNTTENHPIIALEMKAAIAAGAALVLVEPRQIELARFATVWLRQRPGTDLAVFNGMAHVIVREGWHNRDFVAARTEGLDAFARSLEPFTLEAVEAISGVPAADLVEAARLYAQSPASGIYWGMGISQHASGTNSALSLVNLALLCGHIGRPGTGLNPLRGQNNVQGAGDMGCLPNVLPGYQPASDPAVREKFSRAWGVPLSDRPGITATEMVEAAGRGDFRGLFVMGENPMLTDPNLHHARECLLNLDFLVVQDIFMTETAEVADVVLPARAFGEKDGTTTNTERRVQRVRQALQPPGQTRLDWEILSDLAGHLGYRMSYPGPAEIMAEIAAVVPAYGGIDYARLEQGGLQWPCPAPDHPGTPWLFTDSFPRGRGKFHPVPYQPPAEGTDSQYPLALTTGRVLYHWHAGVISRRSGGLDEIYPEALVELHPADAARLGVADGSAVRVWSRRGEVRARAHVTDRSPEGAVFMTFHFAEAAANLLTIDALDPHAKIPEFKVCAVAVEPA